MRLGRAVQVDPVKPTLKAPGTKRLKLIYAELLSNFGFKFNLRRYTSGGQVLCSSLSLDRIRPDTLKFLDVKLLGRYNLKVGPARCLGCLGIHHCLLVVHLCTLT